ncbi:hypothetical protein ACHAWF_003648 [Thalassiosira exigua]
MASSSENNAKIQYKQTSTDFRRVGEDCCPVVIDCDGSTRKGSARPERTQTTPPKPKPALQSIPSIADTSPRDPVGRHGRNLAPRLLQRTPGPARRPTRRPRRSAPEPQSREGAHGPDYVRRLRRSRPYIHAGAVLALYATGRTTGDVAMCLRELLSRRWEKSNIDLAWLWSSNGRLAMDIKETLCYVAEDFAAEMAKPEDDMEKTVEISVKGEGAAKLTATIGRERFLCTEILFRPGTLPSNHCPAAAERGDPLPSAASATSAIGIVQATYISIETATSGGAEIFNVLCANVVLAGGNTMFPGFGDRFSKDRTFVKVVAPEARKLDAWRGGSTIASRSTYGGSIWLTREEYREDGSRGIHRKFL